MVLNNRSQWCKRTYTKIAFHCVWEYFFFRCKSKQFVDKGFILLLPKRITTRLSYSISSKYCKPIPSAWGVSKNYMASSILMYSGGPKYSDTEVRTGLKEGVDYDFQCFLFFLFFLCISKVYCKNPWYKQPNFSSIKMEQLPFWFLLWRIIDSHFDHKNIRDIYIVIKYRIPELDILIFLHLNSTKCLSNAQRKEEIV